MTNTEWPAPGWYPNGPDDRFWDGAGWTGQRRKAAVSLAIAPKSPALSLIISFLVPGAGTIINGEVGKGVAVLTAWAFCFVSMSFFLIPALGVVGLWIYGMVDGYQGAQRWNLQHGILS